MMINRILIGAIVALATTVVACDRSDDAKKSPSAGAEAPAATTDWSAAKRYDSRGTVTKVDREGKRITLNHEKIGDWMDAMEMPFPVANDAMLDQAEVGKHYSFTVEVVGEDYRISSITPAP
jgi:Cu/Ag efflux protein CusF